MKQYRTVNNLMGWITFIIAATVYCMTIEPTASFWDCPEFITTGYKLEVGHPPGAPFFMLVANLFSQFASDASTVAKMVNYMSAFMSGACILFLFWSITHLVRKLVITDENHITYKQLVTVMGSGLVGALAYTFSDTFWFSAVEGEVYAFSSLFTAVVFWLILKWEDVADEPHSDRWLILIAYLTGLSIGVHLLNLLCLPAIVLVYYYKKVPNADVKGSLLALIASGVLVAVVLYGMVPGIVKVGGWFELLFVNTLGMPFNSGVMVYIVVLAVSIIWGVYESYVERNKLFMAISFVVTIALLGIPFYGHGTSAVVIGVLVISFLFLYLSPNIQAKLKERYRISARTLNTALLCTMMIVIGYSSYAIIVIRSTANTPMDQNSPEDIFTLGEYLGREQYGTRPLFYGQAFSSKVALDVKDGYCSPRISYNGTKFIRKEKATPDEKDSYIEIPGRIEYEYAQNMLFPRMYSSQHANEYHAWVDIKGYDVPYDQCGQMIMVNMPTQWENIKFFFSYQLNWMYWRYFLWNFAGRQNDLQGSGEIEHGNWITGIPFIDNWLVGDQSLLPQELQNNKGHNVFYCLPLLLGIIGLLWQAYRGQKGIQQFWVVFFLFFMTGIAIVLYLNQTPTQPRERDYAFAGSFYAFAIWVGMGVAGLWALLNELLKDKKTAGTGAKKQLGTAIFACFVGLAVPLQMVSQTWDDHDRSGRYVTRDFGMNYLDSVDENGIIFTNGDNDTFPLWYAQEVEGHRTDVKVVNLSYLTTDWYANQVKHPSYEAAGIETLAKPEDYGYDRMNFNYFSAECDTTPVHIFTALRQLYDKKSSENPWGAPMMDYNNFIIPVDIPAAVKAGRISEHEADMADTAIQANMTNDREAMRHGGLTLSQVLSLDMLATSVKNGWKNPIYFASTVPSDYYLALQPYMRSTGMAYEVTPVRNDENSDYEISAVNTDKAYRNITEKFRWGGLDKVTDPSQIYLDETVRKMVTTTRSYIISAATGMINEAAMAERADSVAELDDKARQGLAEFKADRYAKALNLLKLMEEKLPEAASPYAIQVPQRMAQIYARIGIATGNKEASARAVELLENELMRYGKNVKYYQSLNPWQYSTLPQTDKFIETYYMVYLLQDLSDAGGDTEKMVDRLTDLGINFDRIVSILQK